MQRRVQRRCGVIAAALVERAAQRTLGFAEGGASKPRQGTALGPAAQAARQTRLRQAQPEGTLAPCEPENVQSFDKHKRAANGARP